MKSRNVYGIPAELLPPEGVEVASEADIIAAMQNPDGFGKIVSVVVIERDDCDENV